MIPKAACALATSANEHRSTEITRALSVNTFNLGEYIPNLAARAHLSRGEQAVEQIGRHHTGGNRRLADADARRRG